MTAISHNTSSATRSYGVNITRINILAGCIEHLTEHRVSEERSLAQQANWLAVQIDENSDDLSRVILLAGMGLDLSQPRLKDDDMLPNELFFLFGEIADEAVQLKAA